MDAIGLLQASALIVLIAMALLLLSRLLFAWTGQGCASIEEARSSARAVERYLRQLSKFDDERGTPEMANILIQVTGSIAALMQEDVWERLLKGERIAVKEPDGRGVWLTCDEIQRAIHEHAGRNDARKIADYYRGLVQKAMQTNLRNEEIARYGIVVEGKD